MHAGTKFPHGAGTSNRHKEHKADAPQVEHRSAMEARDGSGTQTSEHPAKKQSKKMRFLRH